MNVGNSCWSNVSAVSVCQALLYTEQLERRLFSLDFFASLWRYAGDCPRHLDRRESRAGVVGNAEGFVSAYRSCTRRWADWRAGSGEEHAG